ncbi:class I SAM-dependent methyltransferase [Cochleicola gelatinilyticus]|uniref:SAM-dependent methyltransferase n=1 Tax=Cochleicola gelatinilyticus TaxID=1763537 RepID=A0A167IZR5_9FLAO|nr:class I SAM-dependent methyltransferase [Cochleicola gelatinilyticus]OAB80175.1 SAM-dependent methyltransferase [Cochleicola gelatinilyticus]
MSKEKKPWPTVDAMKQIYEKKLWGGSTPDFYSGIGSHHPDIVQPYTRVLTKFLTSFKNPLTVCDLGCGDFNVGKELVKHTKQFIAVDIVPELIERNRSTYSNKNLEFHCLNISTNELPAADCALLRQVLQHLSNAEVQEIVNKLPNYKYVILTEHLPVEDFKPNKDIISGQGIRLKKQSGLNLLLPPFNYNPKAQTELLSITLESGRGRIVTTLYEN